jgi:hypothetical protein
VAGRRVLPGRELERLSARAGTAPAAGRFEEREKTERLQVWKSGRDAIEDVAERVGSRVPVRVGVGRRADTETVADDDRNPATGRALAARD